jgi:HEAT repeat protein
MALDKNEAVPILENIVRSESDSIRTRQQGILILSLLGDERSIDTLLEMLNAPDAGLRAHAGEALGRFKRLSSGGFQRLMAALKDEDAFVRERTAKALAELKRPEALEALRQMRDSDPVDTNREMAQEAIKAIDPTA